MSAKIFSFTQAVNDRAQHAIAEADAKPSRKLYVTNLEDFSDTYEEVIDSWRIAASQNRLSTYIRSHLPTTCHVQDGDYVNDLNLLATVEQKLGMKVIVFYPECSTPDGYGWLAGFNRGKEFFSTMPDMATEANARALNIMLYLAFEKYMKTLGRK